MTNFLKLVFKLFVLLFIFKKYDCLPINKTELPLEIQALQNPNLFGGDILGFDKNSFKDTNSIPDPNKLWPLGTIPYVIDSNLASYKSQIITAMNQYHQNTCIRFVERTDEYDYIFITKENGCYSYVGRTGGKQIVSLGNGCTPIGTIVHELGHSVGFFHEHQRYDRDDYIDVFPENVEQGLMDQFDIINKEFNLPLVEFDFSSIMLYGPLTFSKDGKSKTMAPNKAHEKETMLEVYQKYGLSDLNIEEIKKLYEC